MKTIVFLLAWLQILSASGATMLRATALWIVLIPLALGFAGAASNQAVLIANHDKFPVMVNYAKQAHYTEAGAVGEMLDDTHCLMSSETHLNALADIFDLHSKGIESIGDLMIDFSGWLWGFVPFVWGFEVSRKLLGGLK